MSDPASAAFVCRLLSRARELGALIQPRSSSFSVRLWDPSGTKQKLTPFIVTTDGGICTGWLAGQLETIGADPAIASAWVQRITSLVPGVIPSPAAPDMLSRNVGVDEIAPMLDDFLETLAETIEAVEESVG